MIVPSGMTQQEVIDTITLVATRVAPKHRFGYHESNDLIQEGFIRGMEAMEDYEPPRPLENYLAVCISNRLKNFKRDNFFRPDSVDPEGNSQYDSKRNLMEPLSIDSVQDERELNMWTKIDFLNEIQVQDIFTLIDRFLPVHLRADFLRMKQGVLIPKPRRAKVEALIITILEENGYETW